MKVLKKNCDIFQPGPYNPVFLGLLSLQLQHGLQYNAHTAPQLNIRPLKVLGFATDRLRM